MAIRRTKETYPTNQVKKLNVQYSYHAPSRPLADLNQPKEEVPSVSKSLFKYDVKLIFNDLKKTALITIVIFIILFGVTWYLKR